MDHFILPTGTTPYISVPYRCALTYTPGDFMSFPELHGWTNDHLYGDDDFGHKHPAEIEGFCQSWLYFGMLLEVLHLAGVQANTDDFVARDNENATAFVTTKSLSSLLRRWKGKRKVSSQCNCYLFATEGGEYRPTEAYLQSAACKRKTCWLKLITMADIETLNTILRILEKVRWFIERYCGIRENTKMTPAVKNWPLDDTIALSIAALGFTFSEAIEDIYRLRGGSKLSWNVDILLTDRLRSANWCPSRIDLTVTDFSIDGLYYLAADPQQDTEDHTLCKELRCVSKGLNRDVYRTRHITDDCQCEHHEPPLDEMLEIISSGGTPLVVWTQTKGKQLRVQKFISTPGHVPSVEIGENGKPLVPERAPIYVAISHVWADGLGNENQNFLPACQLSRIQSLVDEIYGFGPNGKPGHVPFWMDTLCVPVRKEHDSYRKKCIVAMRTIYQEAAAVLVLDAGVQTVPVSAPLVDQCMAVYGSGWVGRLWTFQEGFLARQLLFRFQNASVDTATMEQQLFEYTEALRRHGQYTPFVTIAQGSVTGYYMLLKTAVNRLRLGELNPNEPNAAFLSLMGSLSQRRTTCASDEVLCAATILGMDPTPFLDPERSSPDDLSKDDVSHADLRMEAFMRYIGRFPAGIIFNRLPRLQRNGYRWAPRSLMAGRKSDMTLGMDLNHGYNRTGRMCRVDGSSVRLAVEYPGFILGSSSSFAGIKKGRMVLSSSSSSSSNSTSHYQVELFPEDDSNPLTWNAKLQYFLIVAKIPTKEADGWSAAVLGSRATNDDGLKLRHECCARIKLISSPTSSAEEGDDTTITCETLEVDTIWVVQ